MDHAALCEEVLRIDPTVRFVGVCDETGEIRHGGHRDGVKSLLTPDESKQSLTWEMARWRLGDSLATKIGKGQYALTAYDKIKRITLPLDERHFLLVSIDVNADHDKIIDSILWLRERML